MKTRLTQGLATMAVFGALALGVVGGTGSVGAASTGLEPHVSIAASGHQALLPAGFGHATTTLGGLNSAGGTDDAGQSSVASGHLPLTKGGRFP